ncbi:actin filament-associated protein 1 isoform X2 [Eptesicus fuscus]|uniref:actin filament-associated protein 1 isoform X2 n=1 Tax=Eptesicus fuscus TaxID=29078 RepID=UPI0024043FA8|nr:actin filament-associated protein 1 isoform X2 [Eptesicus fuscus]
MEELIVELRLFLELLDHEYLTSTVREKKAVVTDILLRIQASQGSEARDHAPKQEAPSSLPAPPQMPLPEIPQPWLPPDSGPPPLPTSSLPEGYYEEAVPLSPGKAPEYITSNYDSDAMSSSYESYDEEEEDGKGKKTRHQWPSEEASMDLVKDAKICAFLLRKKRFGQWTKLLCVIKDTKLLCYKSSKDQQPQMELPLPGCSIAYIPKDGKKKKHELKITQQGTDPLVLAVQSQEQAEQWLKVIREVYSGCSGPVDAECPPPPGSPVHKAELEKKLSSERPSSDGEGVLENGVAVCNGKEQVKRKKSSKSEGKGTVSKVTGKKITKIIGLGKKKPSTDEQTSSAEEDVPTCGGVLGRHGPVDRGPAGGDGVLHRPRRAALRLHRRGDVGQHHPDGQADLLLKSKKPPLASSGAAGKGKTLSSQPKKAEPAAGVRRTPSNADQYRYGKNRVEADARRLQSQEEELLRRKEALRTRLAQLRKERRDLRAAIEANAGRKAQLALEEKLKALEEECRRKEAERVSLELELTEVTESLRKALAGGVTLGLAIEPRSGTSSPQSPVLRPRTLENSPLSSCETSDAEGPVPVNSAAVLRKSRPAGSSPCRGHVLRKAKEWELKNGT